MKTSKIFLVALSMAILPLIASAESITVNFEPSTYTVGNINGQDGWLKTGPYDAAVTATGVPVGFGTQSLRMSDAVTTGAFGDQVFAKPLINSVGEIDSTNGAFSAGTKEKHLEVQFDLASTSAVLQPGMHISVSPDRGDGSRMSYLRFDDLADGIHIFFDDVTNPSQVVDAYVFNETDIATIDRNPHTIKLTLDAFDGPNNDVVKVYVDSVLKITGTSWEDYYRYASEQSFEQSPRIIKTVLFRESGTATPANAGNGFLIDNFSMSATSDTTAPTLLTLKPVLPNSNVLNLDLLTTSFTNLPWQIGGFEATYSEAVMGASNTTLTGSFTGTYVSGNGTSVIRWSVPTFSPGNFTVGVGSVSDLSGNPSTATPDMAFYTKNGDVSGDQMVKQIDLTLIQSHYTASHPYDVRYDLNGDLAVNSTDYLICRSNLNQ